jgi:hypothetical protein
MKKLMFLLVAASALSASAQEATVLGGHVENGAFGGPALKVTSVNGENAVLTGARGGWIVNHSFVLGVGAYGLVTNVKANTTDPVHQYVDMGYGGLELEYVLRSNDLVHLSAGLLVGGGGMEYEDDDRPDVSRLSFFVLEPSVSANLNVTRFFRVSAGVSYRYVTGLKSALSTDSDLSAPAAMVTFKFGKF